MANSSLDDPPLCCRSATRPSRAARASARHCQAFLLIALEGVGALCCGCMGWLPWRRFWVRVPPGVDPGNYLLMMAVFEAQSPSTPGGVCLV